MLKFLPAVIRVLPRSRLSPQRSRPAQRTARLKTGTTCTILADLITYRPNGPLATVLYGDGFTQTRSYDLSCVGWVKPTSFCGSHCHLITRRVSPLRRRPHHHRNPHRCQIPRPMVPKRIRLAPELDAGLRSHYGAVYRGGPAGVDRRGECVWVCAAEPGAVD